MQLNCNSLIAGAILHMYLKLETGSSGIDLLESTLFCSERTEMTSWDRATACFVFAVNILIHNLYTDAYTRTCICTVPLLRKLLVYVGALTSVCASTHVCMLEYLLSWEYHDPQPHSQAMRLQELSITTS